MGNLLIKFIFFLLVYLLSVFFTGAHGQSYEWWNTRHQWDGSTHWHRYIRLSPAFMGPNALPVPVPARGILPDQLILKSNGVLHFAEGDRTQNLEMNLYVPLFSDRLGLELYLVPVEHYRTDTLTRDLRRARGISGEGWAIGDLHIGTHIQLLRDHVQLPDITLAIQLKTASGSKLSDARYTDTPGYYFQLAFGKKIAIAKNHFRIFASTGLYVWQTFGDRHYQNDALMYGLGWQFEAPHWQLHQSLDGYSGYIGDGDRPALLRIGLTTRRKQPLNYTLGWQRGLNDFPYTSWQAGIQYAIAVRQKS